MLEFWKNGKNIRITPIYSDGQVGQMVIYGEDVCWGENPDPIEYPLSQYPCPSIFTIVEKVEGKEGYYVFKDINGNLIKLHDTRFGGSQDFVYDAQEWLSWNELHKKEKLSRKDKKITQLEGHLNLLKDILIKQGIRIVTKSQAETLGIETLDAK